MQEGGLIGVDAHVCGEADTTRFAAHICFFYLIGYGRIANPRKLIAYRHFVQRLRPVPCAKSAVYIASRAMLASEMVGETSLLHSSSKRTNVN